MAIIIQVQRRETGMWATLSDGTVFEFKPEQTDVIYASFNARADFDPETLASAETVDDGSDAGGDEAGTADNGAGSSTADNGAGTDGSGNEASTGADDGSAPTQAATDDEIVIGGQANSAATEPSTDEGKAE